MKENSQKNSNLKRTLSRLFLWLPILLVAMGLLAFSFFQIPKIQTKFLNKVSFLISENTGFSVSIGHANLTWFDHMIIEDFRLYDHQNDSTLISVNHIKVDFKLYDFVINRKLNADKLELFQPFVHVIKEDDSTEVNISRFITDLKDIFKKNRKNKEKKTSLTLDEVLIVDGVFSYNDRRYDSLRIGKDYRHFSYDSIHAQVSNFSFINDSLGMTIESMHSIDPTNYLNIESMQSDFSFTKNHMTFSNFDLHTPESHIRDSIRFSYEHPSQFKYFNDSITFYGKLSDSKLSTNEIALFSSSLNKINQLINVNGRLQGSINRLQANDIEIKLPGNSKIKGDASFFGLPTIEETFINIAIRESFISFSDFDYLIDPNYHNQLESIQNLNLSGNFMGFLTDFVATCQSNSSVGEIKTDLNFKIKEDNRAYYSGDLNLKNFDLRTIFPNQDKLKHITLNGNINGKGLNKETANFRLKASVDSLKIDNYNYKNLSTNGLFKLGFFNGKLEAKDPNLKFSGKVQIDLKDNKNKFNIKAKLDTANLFLLGFTEQKVNVSSTLDIDMKGLKLDDLVGYVSLYENTINYEGKKLHIDSVKFLSSLIESNRIIHFETDGLSGEMKGYFRNSVFLKTLGEFYQEIKLNLNNNEEDLKAYYNQKLNKDFDKYYVNVELNLWDINKFIKPFHSAFNISKDVKLQGTFQQDSISRLNLYGKIDSISVDKFSSFENYLDINVSKEYYERNTNAIASISSNKQLWSKKYKTQNAFADIKWIEDSMSVNLNIDQQEYGNNLNLRSSVLFFTDSTQIHFKNSNFKILNKEWKWDKTNIITHKNEEWEFHNVKATNGDEVIEASGVYSEYDNKALFIDLKKINIKNIEGIINRKLDGHLDGRIKINRKSENDLLEGNLIARNLKVDDLLLGNLFCISKWQHDQENLDLNLNLVNEGQSKIEVTGLFYPKRDFDQLDLTAKFDSADLKIAEPFLKKNFTKLGGFANGKFSIIGNLNSPILKGSGKISKGHVLVNYLNTTYTFNGNLIFDENEISTTDLIIEDVEHNQALLTGGVFHDGFRNPVLDFYGEFENFKLLNTNAVDNEAYYGTAYGTGNISFLGAINNIKITAEAQTSKGTRISIPLGESSNSKIEQKDYIEFIDLHKNQNIQNIVKDSHAKEKIKIKGIELDFDIEFTPDAYVELIFDVQSGDIIRGRGSGNIELQINTDGDFTMFGDYTISNGGYNFTLYNIINKEFDIKNGSTIAWYGDPYGANLNISASYRQLASLAPLMERFIDPNDINSPETRKKYPSIVDLKLKGNLLNPEIKFDVNIQDYPPNNTIPNSSITLDEVVTAFKANLKNNEQEMNRQVFSLIILRKFSTENSFQVNSQTLGNSLSEFVSNQLSYWATQVDENLEVDVDLAGLSDDAYNTFQLRLSYTFLDGRLRVTRGGNLPNQETKGDVNTIIGDWTVEYLLTDDGRFRVKMYSRSDLDDINAQVGESNFETGFSLQYIKSFDQLNQILSDNRKKNLSKKEKSNVENAEEKEI